MDDLFDSLPVIEGLSMPCIACMHADIPRKGKFEKNNIILHGNFLQK
jgi:hypothetical protein